MSSIDWSAASMKELMENGTVKDVVGKAAGKIKAEAAKPVTLNFGYVSDNDSSAKPVTLNLGYISDDGSSTDGMYRDAIIRELARLRGIAAVGELPTLDARIDELLILLMDMGILAGKIIYDVLDLMAMGMSGFGFAALMCCVLAAIAAFLFSFLAIRILRNLAEEKGYGFFAYYSWGMALFTLILTLMA